MGRISKQLQDVPDTTTTVKRQLEGATSNLVIAPSTDVKRQVSNDLSRLRIATRHPPELRLNVHGPAPHQALDDLLAPELARIAASDTMEFAFSVAELAWRLEDQIATTTDTGAKEGHAVLSQAARLYEHLFMLQTGAEA